MFTWERENEFFDATSSNAATFLPDRSLFSFLCDSVGLNMPDGFCEEVTLCVGSFSRRILESMPPFQHVASFRNQLIFVSSRIQENNHLQFKNLRFLTRSFASSFIGDDTKEKLYKIIYWKSIICNYFRCLLKMAKVGSPKPQSSKVYISSLLYLRRVDVLCFGKIANRPSTRLELKFLRGVPNTRSSGAADALEERRVRNIGLKSPRKMVEFLRETLFF